MNYCKYCNKIINSSRNQQKYCNSLCYHKYRKGKIFPYMKDFIEQTKIRNLINNPAKRIEVRRKMSNTRKILFKTGKIVNWTTKGVPESSRKKMSISIRKVWNNENYRRKMSNTRKILIKEGKIKTSFGVGKDNIAYVHGKSYLPYPDIFNNSFKDKIRLKYNNLCVMCEKSDKKRLAIHHIDYNKDNCDISNLIPLCNSCHQKTNTRNKRDYYTWQFGVYKILFE